MVRSWSFSACFVFFQATKNKEIIDNMRCNLGLAFAISQNCFTEINCQAQGPTPGPTQHQGQGQGQGQDMVWSWSGQVRSV